MLEMFATHVVQISLLASNLYKHLPIDIIQRIFWIT